MIKHAMMILALAGGLLAADAPRTYVGIVTDTMCGADHAHMGIKPDAKCVRECVRMPGGKWKYALLVGQEVYTLSDQQTPDKFAAQKVKVTGVLYPKTGILKVTRMESTE
jgi:hypothetical protein